MMFILQLTTFASIFILTQSKNIKGSEKIRSKDGGGFKTIHNNKFPKKQQPRTISPTLKTQQQQKSSRKKKIKPSSLTSTSTTAQKTTIKTKIAATRPSASPSASPTTSSNGSSFLPLDRKLTLQLWYVRGKLDARSKSRLEDTIYDILDQLLFLHDVSVSNLSVRIVSQDLLSSSSLPIEEEDEKGGGGGTRRMRRKLPFIDAAHDSRNGVIFVTSVSDEDDDDNIYPDTSSYDDYVRKEDGDYLYDGDTNKTFRSSSSIVNVSKNDKNQEQDPTTKTAGSKNTIMTTTTNSNQSIPKARITPSWIIQIVLRVNGILLEKTPESDSTSIVVELLRSIFQQTDTQTKILIDYLKNKENSDGGGSSYFETLEGIREVGGDDDGGGAAAAATSNNDDSVVDASDDVGGQNDGGDDGSSVGMIIVALMSTILTSTGLAIFCFHCGWW